LEKYFENGKHLVWFESPEKCVEVAEDYIKYNEPKLVEIQFEGHKLFLEKFTCLDFTKQMLEIGGVSMS
jgi:hypothetical protein